MLVIDIETGPIPLDRLLATDPFPPMEVHPPFDPAAVKLGNTKDPAKIAEKIEAARAKHEEEGRNWEASYAADKLAHEATLIQTAALSATTGQVLCVGLYRPEAPEPFDYLFIGDSGESEATILKQTWTQIKAAVLGKTPLVSFNGHGFDLPFLMRRSWLHDVAIPEGLLAKGKWWNDNFIDLLERWKCGRFGAGEGISLNNLARYLGLEEKSGNGADFARLWAEDRNAALAYLKQDLDLTYRVALRLGAF